MGFKNEQGLQRLGNSLYSSDETPEPSDTARVVQGAIESSKRQRRHRARARDEPHPRLRQLGEIHRNPSTASSVKTSDAYTNPQAA